MDSSHSSFVGKSITNTEVVYDQYDQIANRYQSDDAGILERVQPTKKREGYNHEPETKLSAHVVGNAT